MLVVTIIHNFSLILQVASNTSSLNYIPRIEDNGKELICESDNPDLPGSALRESLLLNIHCKLRYVL